MKTRSWIEWMLLAISIITIFSGLIQLVIPGFVLGMIGSERTATSMHFFGIVGMFMVLFGGALLHTLLQSVPSPIVIFWTGLQKFGASVAVGLGVQKAIFSTLALLVAGFDFLSGMLIALYWVYMRSSK